MPDSNDTNHTAISPVTWKNDCDKIYERALEEIKLEIENSPDPSLNLALNARLDALRDENTRRTVRDFGDVIESSNPAFLSNLQSVLEIAQGGIPKELRKNIVALIEHRETHLPHEISGQMRNDLRLFYDAARFELSTGEPFIALSFAASYMKEFRKRSSEARDHIENIFSEINASPDRAVGWCDRLTGYTSYEMRLDRNIDRLLGVIHSFNNRYANNRIDPWPDHKMPVKLKEKAIYVIGRTETYIRADMPFIDSEQPGYAGQFAALREDVIRSVDEYVNYSEAKDIIALAQRPWGIVPYQQAQP